MDIKGLEEDPVSSAQADGLEFVSLQPVAIVDHVVSTVDEDGLRKILKGDEIGGSKRVDQQEIQDILGKLALISTVPTEMLGQLADKKKKSTSDCCVGAVEVDEYVTKAGGSASNTTKGGQLPVQ